MRIGFFAVGIGRLTSPEWVRTVATSAERLGFASLWAPEHVVLLDRYASKYPYSTGAFPAPTDSPIGDPFPTLAFAAACTKTIRLGTGVCLVPEHNPVVLAKTVATTDLLSTGRLILGTGIGWLQEEFEAIGVSWERRAQRTREYIAAMRKLWEDHITWTRMVIVDFAGGLPDLSFAEKRLLQNQAEIGNAIKPYYGRAAGEALTKLLRTHILEAVPVLANAKAGNKAKLTQALNAWYANANQIASFLTKANPSSWPLPMTTQMMKGHLALTTNEAVARLQGKWSTDIAAYDAVHREILQMADMLSTGIIRQFPQRFR